MSTVSTIILTTGQPGSGKSYTRVKWLVTDFLPNETGVFITNLPLNREKIAADLAVRLGRDEKHFLDRMIVIPMDELRTWENLQNATKDDLKKQRENRSFIPFEYFKSFELKNAHICIDEFHLYFSTSSPLPLRQCWNDFFAEIRKLGCTFEAVTQDLSLIPKDFVGKVGTRYDHLPFGNTRDPFFHIPMADWYELRTGFTGASEQKMAVVEYIKTTSFTGGVKWKQQAAEKFNIEADIYQYYNSYQRNDTGEVGGRVTPGQRLGRKVVFWFLRRNFPRIFFFLLVVGLCIWFFLGGGMLWSMSQFIGLMGRFQKANTEKKAVPAAPAPVGRSVSVSGGRVVETPISAPDPRAAAAVAAMRQASGMYQVEPEPDLSSCAPVLFFDGSVWLKNGLKITIGYKFTQGVLNGCTVQKIDLEDRYFQLDDGRIVTMF